MQKLPLRLLGLCLILALSACDKPTAGEKGPHYAGVSAREHRPVYRLAIHPLHNPQNLINIYAPLITYLDKNIPEARFELEASRDYASYEAKFRARSPEFLLPNPWQTLEAMKAGYLVIAMAGDAEDFKGIFIARKDSPIRKAEDLKGRVVSYPAPTALAAAILPQYFLHNKGIDINRDIKNSYVGSQESSITHVYLRQADVAASWPPPWRAFQKTHPRESEELEVIWETPHLLNNSVMVRDDIPAHMRERVRNLLLAMDKSEEGRSILAAIETRRFHAANDASYEPVRKFIQRFEREVRPVEQK